MKRYGSVPVPKKSMIEGIAEAENHFIAAQLL
jgi:hypothetical protein